MKKSVTDLTSPPLRLLIRDLCVQQAPKTPVAEIHFRVDTLLSQQLDHHGYTAPCLARFAAQLARGLSGATPADRDAAVTILFQNLMRRRALRTFTQIWTEPLGSEIKHAFQFSVTCGRVCLELAKELREKGIENPSLEAALVNVTRAAARFARLGIMHEGAVTSRICQLVTFQRSVNRLTGRLRAFTQNAEDTEDYVSFRRHITASKPQTSALVASPPKRAPHRYERPLGQKPPLTQPTRRTLH